MRELKPILAISCILLFCFCCKKRGYEQPDNNNPRKTQEQLIAANRALVKKDKLRIQGAVKRNEWNMQESETGLWYEILQPGNERQAEAGLIATIKYKISLLDGTVCYSSDELGNKVFEIGRGGVESGLEQGILLCSVGTKARFILPPYLAHGLPGDGNRIPSRAIIIYEIEVISLAENK